MSLRSSNQQPPVKYVKCDRLQPRIEPVTEDLSPARGTARPCHQHILMLMGGRGFRLGKVEIVGIEGIAYYDGQFKTGIPEGVLTFPFSLQKKSNIIFSLKHFLPLILAYFRWC